MTQSLLHTATKIQDETARSEVAAEELATEESKQHARLLHELRQSVDAQLEGLDGQQVPRGVFKLEKRPDAWLITCTAESSTYAAKVLWYKAEVVSGTWDASDDCRDIPYTAPCLTIRMYPPNVRQDHDGTWDLEQRRYYHNGGWEWPASTSDEVSYMLYELANYLARWL